MELDGFIEKFRTFLMQVSRRELDFYLFGSFLTSEQYSDIDILIVYEDFEVLSLIKKIIFNEFSELPIHITSLKNSEEKELNFISKVNAILIK